MKCIKWNDNGWTVVQNADGKKHVLEISCRAEDGQVVETRIRHHSGEETQGIVLLNGENALPMPIKEFGKLFNKNQLEIK